MEPEIDYKGNLRHFHAALRIFVRQMNDMGGKMNCSISQPYTLDKMDNLPAHIVHVVFWLSDKLADRSIYLDASEYATDRTKIYPAVSWLDNKDGKSWERNEPLFEIIRAYFSDKETEKLPDDELTEQEDVIANCLARKMPVDEIASELTIEPKTVKTHIYNIKKKWKISGRATHKVMCQEAERRTKERIRKA